MERENSINTISILGFIFAFFLSPVGLILSIIGLVVELLALLVILFVGPSAFTGTLTFRGLLFWFFIFFLVQSAGTLIWLQRIYINHKKKTQNKFYLIAKYILITITVITTGFEKQETISSIGVENLVTNTWNKKINSIPTPTENKEPQGDLDIPS